MTCSFLAAPNMDATYAYLLAKGIDVKKRLSLDCGMKEWYLKDPDGYGICFQSA